MLKTIKNFKDWLLFLFGATIITSNSNQELVIIPREGWNARPPKQIEPLIHPVQLVVIHHSFIPSACHTLNECIESMQWMQDFHQNNRSWNDIGYNFAIGSDGRVYTGRDWSTIGAHTLHYNNNSVGICLIGDWSIHLPTKQQLESTKLLIQFGINNEKIDKNYKLIGHRQANHYTVCPGDALFHEIMTWPHFSTDF